VPRDDSQAVVEDVELGDRRTVERRFQRVNLLIGAVGLDGQQDDGRQPKRLGLSPRLRVEMADLNVRTLVRCPPCGEPAVEDGDQPAGILLSQRPGFGCGMLSQGACGSRKSVRGGSSSKGVVDRHGIVGDVAGAWQARMQAETAGRQPDSPDRLAVAAPARIPGPGGSRSPSGSTSGTRRSIWS
jgi:hypothetical protein